MTGMNHQPTHERSVLQINEMPLNIDRSVRIAIAVGLNPIYPWRCPLTLDCSMSPSMVTNTAVSMPTFETSSSMSSCACNDRNGNGMRRAPRPCNDVKSVMRGAPCTALVTNEHEHLS